MLSQTQSGDVTTGTKLLTRDEQVMGSSGHLMTQLLHRRVYSGHSMHILCLLLHVNINCTCFKVNVLILFDNFLPLNEK